MLFQPFKRRGFCLTFLEPAGARGRTLGRWINTYVAGKLPNSRWCTIYTEVTEHFQQDTNARPTSTNPKKLTYDYTPLTHSWPPTVNLSLAIGSPSPMPFTRLYPSMVCSCSPGSQATESSQAVFRKLPPRTSHRASKTSYNRQTLKNVNSSAKTLPAHPLLGLQLSWSCFSQSLPSVRHSPHSTSYGPANVQDFVAIKRATDRRSSRRGLRTTCVISLKQPGSPGSAFPR